MSKTLYIERMINPHDVPRQGVRLVIDDGHIRDIKTNESPKKGDLIYADHVASPALINAHEHLKYTWTEQIGRKGSYEDSYEWLPTLYSEAQERFLSRVSIDDLYWLGTYKNLLHGATTVANHCRRFSNQADFFSRFPIRILFDFTREIFVRYDVRAHPMGNGAEWEAATAKRLRLPFIIHIAEGHNQRTAGELEELREMGGLFERTVLIHGLNLSQDDIKHISQAGASVVWCPVSNEFLFGKTAPLRQLMNHRVYVAVVTDSSFTGATNISAEIMIAAQKLADVIEPERVWPSLLEMVTHNAANAFGLSDVGRIRIGGVADLIVYRCHETDPYKGLGSLDTNTIAMTLCKGKWLMTEGASSSVLEPAMSRWVDLGENGRSKKVVGDPLQLLLRVAEASGEPASNFPLAEDIGFVG